MRGGRVRYALQGKVTEDGGAPEDRERVGWHWRKERQGAVAWTEGRAADVGWKSGGGSLGTTSPTRPERRRRPNWRRESTGAIIRWYRLAERVRCGDATGGEWR
jgi:hypothetical protein